MKPQKKKSATGVSVPLEQAEVLSVVDLDTVFIRFRKQPAEEMVRATLAVPHYVPQAGDRVLVSAAGGETAVLGVLGEARRRADPAALCKGLVARRSDDGTVSLFATDGPLTLGALDGVQIAAPHVSIRGERVEVTADRIVETAVAVYTHAEDLAQTTGKRVRAIADDTYEIQAKRTVLASDDDTVIDGKRVLLG